MLGLLAILLLLSALAFLGIWAAVKTREPWIGFAAGPIEEAQVALSGESRERFGKIPFGREPTAEEKPHPEEGSLRRVISRRVRGPDDPMENAGAA